MQSVLIIENDLLIADMLYEVVCNDRFAVRGIARTVEQAIGLAAQHRPQLAIVDVRLSKGDLGTTAAAILMAEYNTGILYTTGSMDALTNASGHAVLLKPFLLHHVEPALSVVAELVETGTSKLPRPPRMIMLPYQIRAI